MVETHESNFMIVGVKIIINKLQFFIYESPEAHLFLVAPLWD